MSHRAKAAGAAALLEAGLAPRLLELPLAAAYVRLSPEAFLKGVRAGRYPKPLAEGRRKRWDVRALDAALDRRSGLEAPRDESPDALTRAFHDYHARAAD